MKRENFQPALRLVRSRPAAAAAFARGKKPLIEYASADWRFSRRSRLSSSLQALKIMRKGGDIFGCEYAFLIPGSRGFPECYISMALSTSSENRVNLHIEEGRRMTKIQACYRWFSFPIPPRGANRGCVVGKFDAHGFRNGLFIRKWYLLTVYAILVIPGSCTSCFSTYGQSISMNQQGIDDWSFSLL